MKAVSCESYEHWTREDAAACNNIIYLSDYAPRRMRSRRRKNNGDLLWNVIFVGLCLSVLVILFLH
jgi:hypothetical protein